MPISAPRTTNCLGALTRHSRANATTVTGWPPNRPASHGDRDRDQRHLHAGHRQRGEQGGLEQRAGSIRHLHQARGLLLDRQEHPEPGDEGQRPERAEVRVLRRGHAAGDDGQVGVDEQPGSDDAQAHQAERPRPRPGAAAGQDRDLPGQPTVGVPRSRLCRRGQFSTDRRRADALAHRDDRGDHAPQTAREATPALRTTASVPRPALEGKHRHPARRPRGWWRLPVRWRCRSYRSR